MLSLPEKWRKNAGSGGSAAYHVVEVAGQRFTDAPRTLALGYPNSVVAVTPLSATLNPLSCEQSLSQITVELDADDRVMALVDEYLVGKSLTVWIAFDTGSELGFSAGDLAPYQKGAISRYERKAGRLILVANDARAAIWGGRKNARVLPDGKQDPGDVENPPGVQGTPRFGTYSEWGAASIAVQRLFLSSGISVDSLALPTFAGSGAPYHLVVDRVGGMTGAFSRSLKEPTPVAQLANEIARVCRAYVLAQEDGRLYFKPCVLSAPEVDRFTENDITPGSFSCGLDDSLVVESVVVRSGWNADGDSEFTMIYRDDVGPPEVLWKQDDGTARQADYAIDDRWFTQHVGTDLPATLVNGQYVRVFAFNSTSLKVVRHNFTGSQYLCPTQDYPGQQPLPNGWQRRCPNPAPVSESVPGYLFVRGVDPAQSTGQAPDAGEVVRYTQSQASNFFSHALSGITRGAFNTVVRDHTGPSVQIGPQAVDCTAVVYAGDQIIRRFSEGAHWVTFQTGLHKYNVQLGDVVGLETALFVRPGLNGLVAGNTEKFECVGKDVDVVAGVVQWRLVELRDRARTQNPKGPFGGLPNARTDVGNELGTHGWGGGGLGPIFDDSGDGGLGGGLNKSTWVGGKTPTAPLTGLDLELPAQKYVALGRGVVPTPRLGRSFVANTDTYVDLLLKDASGRGEWIYTEVPTGSVSPVVPDGCVRAFKVATSATGVSGVTDLREKALGTVSRMAVTPPASTGFPYAHLWDEGTTNHVKNPSFETNTDNWENQGATITRDTSTFVWGVACAKVAMPTGGSADSVQTTNASNPAAAQNEAWVLSAWLAASAASKEVKLRIEFVDSTDSFIEAFETTITLGTTFSRYWIAATATSANTAKARCQLRRGSTAGAFDVFMDGVQLEKGQDRPTLYTDGTLGPGYAWTDPTNPHNSTSTRTAGRHDVSAMTSLARPVWIGSDGTLRAEFMGQFGDDRGFIELSSGVAGGGQNTIRCSGTTVDQDLAVRSAGAGNIFLAPISGGEVLVAPASSKTDAAAMSARKTNTQSVGTGATTIVYGTEDHDYGSDYNNTTGVFTVPQTGWYVISYNAYFTAIPDAQLVWTYIADASGNHIGGGDRRMSSASNTDLETNGKMLARLTSGTGVRIDAVTSGAARTVDGTGVTMRFSVMRFA